MNKLLRNLISLVALALLWSASCCGVAWADGNEASDQTKLLCTRTSIPCSIQAPEETREGVRYDVAVTGREGATIEVQAYLVEHDGSKILGFTPYGDPHPVTLNNSGSGRAQIPLFALPHGTVGTWVFFSTSDISGTDVSSMVGSFVPFGTRKPDVLGDGFGLEKPVGEQIDLQFTGAIPYSRFVVEMRGEDGIWRSVTDKTIPDSGLALGSGGVSHVYYEIPRGLANHEFTFRLRNISLPTVATEWKGRPANNPGTQARKPILVPPVPGTNLDGALIVTKRNSMPIQIITSALAGLSLFLVLGIGVVKPGQRRPRFRDDQAEVLSNAGGSQC